MKLRPLCYDLSVCKVNTWKDIPIDMPFCYIARTEEEISLVCPRDFVPEKTTAREDTWRAFRIEGVLDFSMTGVLSNLSSILSEHDIPIFAVSTYNTDYILVKQEKFDKALTVLAECGYEVMR